MIEVIDIQDPNVDKAKREAVEYMLKRRMDAYGPERVYYDMAIEALTEANYAEK